MSLAGAAVGGVIAPFTLRPARALDALAVVRWFPTRASVVLWAGPGLPEPLHGMWLAREVARQRHYVLIGPEGGLAGFFGVTFHLGERRAHLIRFALAPGLRGRGLGDVLVRAAVEVASSQGAAERLTLAVYAHNAPARRTYERAGFGAYARAGQEVTPEGEVVRMVLEL